MAAKLRQNIIDFVRALDEEERTTLLGALQAARPYNCLDLRWEQQQLLQAELWLGRQIELARSATQQNSRRRLWLIFMLLRYGALKLKEVFALTEEHLDFINGNVVVENRAGKRIIPLPAEAAEAMRKAWLSWSRNLSVATPLACDASQLRRALATCARACGIGPAMLNASGLRRHRGLELQAEGLPYPLAAYFMGKNQSPAPYTLARASELINICVKGKTMVKTSARNVFRGQIVQIEEYGILANVSIETSTGLTVKAIITETSRNSLELKEGLVINALVKAPWVNVLPLGERAAAGAENCYEGKVERIKRDTMACEILVSLQQGNQICALYANGSRPSDDIQENAGVIVAFSPFSVILTAD